MPTTFAAKAKNEEWNASLTSEGALVRWALIALALGYLTLFLFVPLAAVFAEALKNGLAGYFASFCDTSQTAERSPFLSADS